MNVNIQWTFSLYYNELLRIILEQLANLFTMLHAHFTCQIIHVGERIAVAVIEIHPTSINLHILADGVGHVALRDLRHLLWAIMDLLHYHSLRLLLIRGVTVM